MNTSAIGLLGAVALGFLLPGVSRGQEYQVELGGESLVAFISDAPLEDFRGVTSRVDGFVFLPAGSLDPGKGLDGSEFHFEVDLASLDTGLGLRNRHMRENYLETHRFPYAVFSGGIESLRQDGNGRFGVVATGAFEVHGVSQSRSISCRVTSDEMELLPQEEVLTEGPLAPFPDLRVQCAFQVVLSDHGIPIPKLMFMKIDEVMDVEVEFRLLKVTGGEDLKLARFHDQMESRTDVDPKIEVRP